MTYHRQARLAQDAAGAGPNAATLLRGPGAEDTASQLYPWRASGTSMRSAREGGQ